MTVAGRKTVCFKGMDLGRVTELQQQVTHSRLHRQHILISLDEVRKEKRTKSLVDVKGE